MNLKIICQRENELLEVKKELKIELLKDKYKSFKVKFVPRTCKHTHIYIIISNDLEFIYKNSFECKNKEETYNNLVILTSNLRSANIVGCLNLTPFVYYIKSKIEAIAFKIIKIANTKETRPIISSKKR